MKPTRASDWVDAEQVPNGNMLDRRGHRLPSTLEAIAARDRNLIVAIGFFPGLSDRECARRLRTALMRYQSGRWRHSRSDIENPHPADRIEATLWRLLKVRDAVPSERLIRLVLSRNS